MLHRLPIALMLLFAAAPAGATASAQVPEGSSLTLFALGVLGVIVGRRLSMRKSNKDD
ncbi:MAG: hypothetical protein JY451_02640 [Erythrobacter sp.]|nr:MAG: hypothetical protein JY451_02640 [Erythrobacter sp.]